MDLPFLRNACLATVLVLSAWHCAPGSAADLHVVVKDRDGKPVMDAVALALPTDPKLALRAQPGAAMDEVDQVDKQFVPYVRVVFVGSKIRFPNSDHVRHQVYSFSPAKRFELPLYAGTPAQPILFDKAGVVVLGCNIHDWMVGYIYVSETPFFAKTGRTGSATITGLPAGEYLVRIWQPSIEGGEVGTTRRIVVGGKSAGLDTPDELAEWTIKLKPTFPISRSSGGASAAYP
jgi:plastocyanin